MKLETPRLFLRELTAGDFNALYAVLANSNIMRHYPYTFNKTRVQNWINRNIERYRVFGFGLWAVCLKSTGDDWRLRINPANCKWNHFAGDWLPHCTAAPAPRLRQGGGTGRSQLGLFAHAVRRSVFLHEKG